MRDGFREAFIQKQTPSFEFDRAGALHLEVELESALGLEPGKLERGGLSSKEGEEARGEHGGEHGAARRWARVALPAYYRFGHGRVKLAAGTQPAIIKPELPRKRHRGGHRDVEAAGW